MRHAQRGVSLLLVAVVLIIVVGAVLAFLALFGTNHGVATFADTQIRLQRAQGALEQFVSATGRLPCPADPTLSTGDANPDTATTTCTTPTGSLPWHTIGLRSDDGLDAWGWKISYRVFDGATGLTQDQGASMVPCTSLPLPPSPPLLPSGLCDSTGNHSDAAAFVGTKGLHVTDYGASISGVAYVVISHGATGLGTYTVTGTATSTPVSVEEIGNTTATGQTTGTPPIGFVARAASASGVGAADPTHFDDILAYRTILDLATKSSLVARNWASTSLNQASISAALGSSTPVPYGDLGTQTVTVNGNVITVTTAGTAENLTLQNIAGVDGIGGGGGQPTLSSADAEVLHITFAQTDQIFAVTLSGFGCRQTAGTCTDSDAVQFTFYRFGVPVGTQVTKLACNTGNVVSYTIDRGASPAGDFDAIDIAPQPTNPGAGTTALLVAGFVNCPEGATCATALDTGPGPLGNHCP